MFETLTNHIYQMGIVPVVQLEDQNDAIPLANALIHGGLPVAEITFRSDCAKQVIETIHESFPDMLLGAGTVLTKAQVDEAIRAGATFVVSPGFNPTVVEYCLSKGIPILPGVSNPSDIEMAMQFGLDTLKFFPAEVMGGVKALQAYSAPYQRIRFLPTGGVNEANMADYLSLKNVIACGGSWMVKRDLIQTKNFEDVERKTRQAVKKLSEIRREI